MRNFFRTRKPMQIISDVSPIDLTQAAGMTTADLGEADKKETLAYALSRWFNWNGWQSAVD